jgi:hypothetical protein
MKRILIIAALLSGGLAAELAHPAQCLLIAPKPLQVKRRRG